MNRKIFFILIVLFLVVGAGCEKAAKESSNKDIGKDDTESRDSEYYDGLDDAFTELDELEEEDQL